MHNLQAENETRSMMRTDFGFQKADKSKELNNSMTISEQSRDEYESTLHNIGGSNNA